MPTIARQIDALGGAYDGHSEDWSEGHRTAIDDAAEIAHGADELIDELLGCILEVLDGGTTLERWTTEARLLAVRATQRRCA